ncbi:MAG: class I SAM-dependent methyltransferase [Acidimicrobiales bacterium]
MSVADALVEISRSDVGRALAGSEAAASGGSEVARALVEFLARSQDSGVYGEPTAFEAFIDGGGNRRLYERVIEDVGEVHRVLRPTSVLEVGCGDGRVVAGVVDPGLKRLDLVEPSEVLLAEAMAAFEGSDTIVSPRCETIGEFLDRGPDDRRWDLVQATFSLHSLAFSERSEVLRTLATRSNRIVIVEFDVPDFDDRSAAHAAYVAERYEEGVAEYAHAPEAVSGFLMPVMVGQFDPERPRLTYEQSADVWSSQLSDAGWHVVDLAPVHDYWWAAAFMLTANSA